MFEHSGIFHLQISHQRIADDRDADRKKQNVNGDQHGVHNASHHRRDRIVRLDKGLQRNDSSTEDAQNADDHQGEKTAFRQRFLFLEQAKQHNAKTDQQEQPILGGVLHQ